MRVAVFWTPKQRLLLQFPLFIPCQFKWSFRCIIVRTWDSTFVQYVPTVMHKEITPTLNSLQAKSGNIRFYSTENVWMVAQDKWSFCSLTFEGGVMHTKKSRLTIDISFTAITHLAVSYLVCSPIFMLTVRIFSDLFILLLLCYILQQQFPFPSVSSAARGFSILIR